MTATKQAAMRKFCREHDAGDVTEYGKGCVTRRPSFASDSVLHPERGVGGGGGYGLMAVVTMKLVGDFVRPPRTIEKSLFRFVHLSLGHEIQDIWIFPCYIEK